MIPLGRRLVAEGLGTFALVLAGTGAVVANDLSGGAVTHVGVAFAFGAIVMLMVIAFGPVSGAHLNPAVTFGFVVARTFAAREAPAYVAAQCGGAVLASLTLRLLYPDAATYGETVPIGAAVPALVLETLLTGLLMGVILVCALGHRLSAFAAGLSIGGTVALCALFGGPLTGASMNPARTLGPAIVAARLDVLWLYVLGPLAGAGLAVPLFRFVWRDVKPS